MDGSHSVPNVDVPVFTGFYDDQLYTLLSPVPSPNVSNQTDSAHRRNPEASTCLPINHVVTIAVAPKGSSCYLLQLLYCFMYAKGMI